MPLYCDQAAAARPDEEALACFVSACRTLYANQEALHYGANEVRRALDDAGREMARLLTGTDAFTVCWCGSGTGAFQLLESTGILRERRVITSNLEHPALTAMLKRSAREVTELKCTREGRIIFSPGPWDLAAFHAVQSELGTIQDIPALMRALPERCIRFTDAVQLAGKMDLAPVAAASDLIALSGVKFGAPGGRRTAGAEYLPLERTVSQGRKRRPASRLHRAAGPRSGSAEHALRPQKTLCAPSGDVGNDAGYQCFYAPAALSCGPALHRSGRVEFPLHTPSLSAWEAGRRGGQDAQRTGNLRRLGERLRLGKSLGLLRAAGRRVRGQKKLFRAPVQLRTGFLPGTGGISCKKSARGLEKLLNRVYIVQR